MPAILAIAYHSLVGSSGPVSSAVLARSAAARASDRCSDEPRNSSLRDAAAMRRVDDVASRSSGCRGGSRPGRCRWRGCRRPWRPRGTTACGPRRPRSSARRRPGACRSSSPRATPSAISQPSRARPAHERGADHAAVAGDEDAACRRERRKPRIARSRSLRRFALRDRLPDRPRPSRRTSSREARSCGAQPSLPRALEASPSSVSTSVGRK